MQRIWLSALAAMVWLLGVGCSDAAREDCAGCPESRLEACLEAAEDCQGIEGMDDREQCLAEARALCDID